MDIKPPARFTQSSGGNSVPVQPPQPPVLPNHGTQGSLRHPGPFGPGHFGARGPIGPGPRGFRPPMGLDMRMQPGMGRTREGEFFIRDNLQGNAMYQDRHYGMGHHPMGLNHPGCGESH